MKRSRLEEKKRFFFFFLARTEQSIAEEEAALTASLSPQGAPCDASRFSPPFVYIRRKGRRERIYGKIGTEDIAPKEPESPEKAMEDRPSAS